MLTGKRALITGGNRGIGFAIAQAFLQNGAEVVISGRDQGALDAACTQLGSSAHPIVWDVRNAHKAQDIITHAADMLGGLDILVNNAGVNRGMTGLSTSLFQASVQDWDYVMEVNLRSVFFACQAAAIYMAEHGTRGHILNIASEMGFSPANNAYCISKWGVRGMTEGLGLLLAPKGITVNGIAPGPVATRMMQWKEGDSIERQTSPNGRFSLPEEIAEMAVFLTCGKGDTIVGQCVLMDGGHVLTRDKE
jgi:NAD(P)-dependent dehydrogenase (short-subunit alcohol dehydrogenase family)